MIPNATFWVYVGEIALSIQINKSFKTIPYFFSRRE
jgi:hypothetical protein